MSKQSKLVRPLVKQLHAYVPGEQPKIKGLIKLNTNENPYPPSPKVLKAVRAAVDGRLRLYPNPTAERLREKLAKLHRCKPQDIIVGNGSDELLALAVRTFVEPAGTQGCSPVKSLVQFFSPSYSLYPVLAETHGAKTNSVPLEGNFSMPGIENLRKRGDWDFRAALSLVTTPNAPSGRGYSTSSLRKLCAAQKGVVVLDEAYVNFARESAMKLAGEFEHVLVARTFSKAYSLCFQRIGYMVGDEHLVNALHKMRDSYNVNGLGQVAAVATLGDLPYYRQNFAKIRRDRQWIGGELKTMGFEVLPSEANFVLVKPPQGTAKTWVEALRVRGFLVRWFSNCEVSAYFRITIGTRAEMAGLAAAMRTIFRAHTGGCKLGNSKIR